MILIYPLIRGFKRRSGRDLKGKIILSHRGGGLKRKVKLIDYKRYFFFNEYFKVVKIFKDLFRNIYIAIIVSKTGFFSYIVAPAVLLVNYFVITSNRCLISIGNRLVINKLPLGQMVHHIEMTLFKGGQLLRSAGVYGKNIKKYSSLYTLFKLRSGELRLIFSAFYITLGVISNPAKQLESKLKAGENRLLGFRPSVRGVAMNPVDHPHGGGEGKTSGGRPSVSKWGWLTKGKKLKKIKNNFIIKKRC